MLEVLVKNPVFDSWKQQLASEAAFKRLARRDRRLALAWNRHVKELAPQQDRLRNDVEFRKSYDRAVLAVRVDVKERAIRAHLRAWARAKRLAAEAAR